MWPQGKYYNNFHCFSKYQFNCVHTQVKQEIKFPENIFLEKKIKK